MKPLTLGEQKNDVVVREEEARFLLAERVSYHDDPYILLCEKYRGYYTVFEWQTNENIKFISSS